MSAQTFHGMALWPCGLGLGHVLRGTAQHLTSCPQGCSFSLSTCGMTDVLQDFGDTAEASPPAPPAIHEEAGKEESTLSPRPKLGGQLVRTLGTRTQENGG